MQMRNLVFNCLVSAGAAVLAWSLMNALFWIDFQVAKPLPQGESTMEDQAETNPFEERHNRVNAQRNRIRYFHIPAVTLVIVLGVGVLSRSWQWTWLLALVALGPVAIWAGISTSVNIGVAVAAGLFYLLVGTGITTAISWFRNRVRGQSTDSLGGC